MFATMNRFRPALNSSGLEHVDRLFDHLFDGVSASARQAAWSPAWGWWEDEGHLYVEVDLPGTKNQDIELVLDDGKLHLKCQRKAPESDRKYGFNSRQYGEFERVFTLPETIDTENVVAEMHDGVLYVTLSKLPAAQPKRITVKTS